MATRTIRTIGDDVLTKVCKEVKEVTPKTKELIDDMFETCTMPWASDLQQTRSAC